MSVTGKIVNGSVVLPPGTKLPEGASVKIETIVTDDPFLAAVERLAKPRPHLPKDYALNRGHYLRGEPKK
ncbi:MAG: hypothetical protein ABI042_15730 [Verrucomicrobiota bacterium]